MPETVSVPTIGTRVADIPLVDPDGTASRLWTEIAGRAAVLFFMRAADCPICIAHARTLDRMAVAGDLGAARVIVIAPGDSSDAATAKARIGASQMPVRASGEHHADLGLGRFLMLQHSGTFVVDDTGQVRSAVTSPLPTASFSRPKMLEALAALRA
jgi:peroxiredoxin